MCVHKKYVVYVGKTYTIHTIKHPAAHNVLPSEMFDGTDANISSNSRRIYINKACVKLVIYKRKFSRG